MTRCILLFFQTCYCYRIDCYNMKFSSHFCWLQQLVLSLQATSVTTVRLWTLPKATTPFTSTTTYLECMAASPLGICLRCPTVAKIVKSVCCTWCLPWLMSVCLPSNCCPSQASYVEVRQLRWQLSCICIQEMSNRTIHNGRTTDAQRVHRAMCALAGAEVSVVGDEGRMLNCTNLM